MNTLLVEPLLLEPLADAPDLIGPALVTEDLGLIGHVQVKLTAVLGETELSVGDLYGLRPGSVLTLDQALDQAIVLKLDGKPVATANLVAVGDCFGVQVVSIL
ncbi:FliM/FliN family flagellar motor C-terminal domain-containing protein [Pinirhizobacter sp.]|jgi:flagellar motor switch protein FliN/FliY|uniref:FliM/FliN family flagellar motor C-terminal domain-containing protein n=1 Tax=Pinirhizobacter sp. TaxID=2950432 RepID=UPI002F422C8D